MNRDKQIKLFSSKKDGINRRLRNYRYKREYDKTTKINYWSDDHELLEFDSPLSVTSMICNQSFFDQPFVHYWSVKIHDNLFDLLKATNQFSEGCLEEKVIYHRKLWEFVYICQVLYENGMLRDGKSGIAFGVGTECLPDLFASFGCRILATDLEAEDAGKKGWIDTKQNIAGKKEELNKYGFCTEDEFEERVSYRDIDMNNIPNDIEGFDFCWSACALEHLGGIQKGLDFIKNSLNVLKPSGIAVHTTEFNLFSNEDTLETENLSIFRKKDIQKLITELTEEGYYVFPMDWHVGNNIVDNFVDLQPYSSKDMHLRLKIGEYPSTSIGIIIKKGI